MISRAEERRKTKKKDGRRRKKLEGAREMQCDSLFKARYEKQFIIP